MKVNISGRGIIPGLNRLAPVRNVDLPQKDILRLLNYRQFKLYSSETGLLITKTNVNDLFKPTIKKPAPVVEVKTETKTEIVPDIKNQITDTMEPVVEEVKEDIRTEIMEEVEVKPQFLAVTEIPAVKEEKPVEEKLIVEEEIATEVEEKITEETTESTEEEKTIETKPERPYYNKKKNRKR